MSEKLILLDLRALSCPQPLLATKKALKQLVVHDILKVLITDPSSVVDIKVLTATSEYQLLKTIEYANYYEFWLQKK